MKKERKETKNQKMCAKNKNKEKVRGKKLEKIF
jgi:hypothetical protein